MVRDIINKQQPKSSREVLLGHSSKTWWYAYLTVTTILIITIIPAVAVSLYYLSLKVVLD